MSNTTAVLKKLELFGFKSFADRTELQFDAGVSAVVGPNGCGKSNLADSVRWVLGEQRPKALRGSRMEDIIFSGTDAKEPLNLAEVSLTISNEKKIFPIDYEEITISRRIFRSGESEYFINKTPVRLRDINELFMDTGIGCDSYSLIEQGKIDLILSTRPEDRRYLFDEAAGITRYKVKKKEALRKLEQTEENLVRINDIIAEVNRQMRSIQRQADKARRYREVFEELKIKETGLSRLQYQKLIAEKRRIDEERNSRLKEIEELNKKIDERRKRFSAFHLQLSEQEEKLTRINGRIFDIRTSISKHGERATLNEERIKELSSRKVERLRSATETKERIKDIQKEQEKVQEESNRFQEEIESLKQGLAEKDERRKEIDAEIVRARAKITSGKPRLVELLAETSRLKTDSAKINAHIQNLASRKARLDKDREDADLEMKRFQERLSPLLDEISRIDEETALQRKTKEGDEEKLREAKESLEKISKELSEREHKITATEARLASLEELKKTYAGYESGAQAILRTREAGEFSREDVPGTVADIIRVKRGWEKAFETVLAGDLQAILVKDEGVAKNLIDYLRRENLGRAKFLFPQKEEIPSLREKEDTPFEALINFCKVQESCQGIISRLLSSCFVVKDISQGWDYFKDAPHSSFRLVTKSGEIMERSAVRSGSMKEKGGLLSQSAEIDVLREEISSLKTKTADLSRQKEEERRSIEDKEEEVSSLLALIREGEAKIKGLDLDKSRFEKEEEKLKDEMSLLASEISETDEELSNLREKEKENSFALSANQEETDILQNEVREAEESLGELSGERETLLVELARVQTEISSVSKRETNLSATLEMLTSSLSREKESAEGAEKEAREAEAKIAELTREIEGCRQETERLKAEDKEVEKEKEEFLRKREEVSGIIASVQEEESSEMDKLNHRREEDHKLAIAEKEISFKVETLSSRIRETYKLEINEEAAPSEEGTSEEKLTRETEELKGKLIRFGEVNLGAIAEDEELKERFNFLTSQRYDLENAKESLHKAISVINQTTRVLFEETFTKIQETFKEFFRQLFGGGTAKLLLLDESDVLESGIEIVARPPGKKLQIITLLSGGEKALTAIALLFAIFKIKPSPFCILDEIDAPLDEANIDRFSRVLADFVKTSQFIIITHNKKTIGMADVLYGVTMEETGVSKIVSVKFAKEAAEGEPEPATV